VKSNKVTGITVVIHHPFSRARRGRVLINQSKSNQPIEFCFNCVIHRLFFHTCTCICTYTCMCSTPLHIYYTPVILLSATLIVSDHDRFIPSSSNSCDCIDHMYRACQWRTSIQSPEQDVDMQNSSVLLALLCGTKRRQLPTPDTCHFG